MFSEIGDLLEVQGESFFKIRAYRHAADVLNTLGEEVGGMSHGELQSVPGIGNAIASKIVERVSTGSLEFLDRLHEKTPHTVLEITALPGVGPKTAGRLVKIGIVTREKLESGLKDGTVQSQLGDVLANRLAQSVASSPPRSASL